MTALFCEGNVYLPLPSFLSARTVTAKAVRREGKRMTEDQWAGMYSFFTPRECGDEMNYVFMQKILLLRLVIDVSMNIIDGFATSGHADDSYHYRGRALDFWCKLSPRKVMRQIDRLGLFSALGIYWWGYHKPFYHIDDRNEKR